ncbi:MAG TPA: hypothetical protein VM942_06370 [Acidimicrobiales bacterium]|nr:hypothetical protein [Acidimicrobiales bacterium]
MEQEMQDAGHGDRTSNLKGMFTRASGAIKGWFGKAKDSMQSGVGKLKGRSHQTGS